MNKAVWHDCVFSCYTTSTGVHLRCSQIVTLEAILTSYFQYFQISYRDSADFYRDFLASLFIMKQRQTFVTTTFY